jgi:hypothetical protein
VQPQVLAAAGHGLFILASTAIALRLLLLWRRTRQWPELLIGGGLLMPGAVTLPCAALAGLGSATVGEINIPVLAVGLLGAAAGIALVMAFTWRVFRPASRVAAAFALGLSDPVLVNRFGLWGSLGVMQLFNGAVSIAFEASGHGMMTDPLPALWIAVVGLVTGALMLLTFVPPKRYQEWVRVKHADRVATAPA